MGLVLRSYGIDRPNLWFDEAFSVVFAQRDILSVFKLSLNDTTTPLFEIILYFLFRIYPNNEFIARLPSLLAGIGSLFVFYIIITYVLSRRYRIFALLLFSTNLVSLYFSRQARAYALTQFFLLIACYSLIRLVKHWNKTFFLLLIFSNILAFLSHQLAVFFIIGECVVVIFEITKKNEDLALLRFLTLRKKTLIRWFLAFLPVGVMIFIWSLFLIAQVKDASQVFYLQFHPYRSLIGTIGELSFCNLKVNLESLSFIYPFERVLIFAFAVFGTIVEMKYRRKKTPFYSVLFWIPLACMYVVSFKVPIFSVRYISFLTPYFIILIVKGVKACVPKRALQYILIGFFVIGNLLVYFKYLKNDTKKTHFLDLVSYLNKSKKDDDLMLATNALIYTPVRYYSKENFESYIYDSWENIPFYHGKVILTEEDLLYDYVKIKSYKRVWIITDYNRNLENSCLEDTFEKDYKLEATKRFRIKYLCLWVAL